MVERVLAAAHALGDVGPQPNASEQRSHIMSPHPRRMRPADFPASHVDFVTQCIDFHVPVDMFDDIARYDGSCLVDPSAGEVAGRYDSEAANVVSLNLMHEIVVGKRTVKEAREVYGEDTVGYSMGRDAPYPSGSCSR